MVYIRPLFLLFNIALVLKIQNQFNFKLKIVKKHGFMNNEQQRNAIQMMYMFISCILHNKESSQKRRVAFRIKFGCVYLVP